jgi:signal transduction histidine kinase
LAFGAIPLGATIAVGYLVSRGVITTQAEDALRALGGQQAVHLATELTRQRLILSTITGYVGAGRPVAALSPTELGVQLTQSLPEGGVFDGLRLVAGDGQVLTSVALRNTVPRWPARAPAAAWTDAGVAVHWEADSAVAYVIAVPFGEGADVMWLEGHVRSEDFGRLFAMPAHLMGDVESALIDPAGRLILAAHTHAMADLSAAFQDGMPDTTAISQLTIAGTPSLVVTSRVADSDWIFAAALPLASALAPLAGLRNASILAAAVLVLLIAVTATLVARSISTPLGELAAAARRFGRGEPYHPIHDSGAHEVRLLVDAFSQMTDDLRESRSEIMRLHEQEMQRAQQLATVGELASGIAHEVRNPLTGVLGAVDLALRRLPPNDAARPLLEEAQKQLRRIESTTSQLLRYARPPELRELLVDPNGLVGRAAHIIEPQARSAGISIDVEPTTTETVVRSDPELMVQVLVNLMLNGVDAMSAGGILTVWVARHPPHVWIGVRDTGTGIPAAIRADVFRPFFTTKHQGSGLGLSISRQIVERHGGELRLEDTPGGGTTFIVALPLAREEELTGE